MNIKRKIKIFKSSREELLTDILPSELKKAGYKRITRRRFFLYAEGNIPVLLVAHVDTVHENLPVNIFFDRAKGVLWSPEGIGADDRAGVLGILHLISKGYTPYILFTDGEETGGIGAEEAVKTLAPPPVNMMIELDRKGKDEAVFYDCICPEFEQYILNQGFKKAYGSFTDITILCPRWKIAGVNLSAGYYNQHTVAEYFVIPELLNTLKKVEKILKNPAQKKFDIKFKEYMPYFYSISTLSGRFSVHRKNFTLL